MPVHGHFRVSGIRPGVYAGLEKGKIRPVEARSRAFSREGLQPDASARALTVRNPVNGAQHETTKNTLFGFRQPGVNAGPNTAFDGKGRERPSLSSPCVNWMTIAKVGVAVVLPPPLQMRQHNCRTNRDLFNPFARFVVAEILRCFRPPRVALVAAGNTMY